MRMLFTITVAFAATLTFNAHAATLGCNTRGGFIASQPEPPILLSSQEIRELPADSFPSVGAIPRQTETIVIDLAKLDSLIKFEGRYTSSVPVLGVRLENNPDFDPTKHCNRILVNLVKPRIEKLSATQWLATVEDGRFRLKFNEGMQREAWIIDPDSSNRFIWIFPATFGQNRKTLEPWNLAIRYDEAFQTAKWGSPQRRWIAEAYVNLALRTYRMTQLVETYPKGELPNRQELNAEFKKQAGHDCDTMSTALICLAGDLIEMNEAAAAGDSLSKDAFRTSDALLQNSGISTGLRQLDFASSNEQAQALGPRLSPTLYRSKRGFAHLRAIRAWEVDLLHGWYVDTGFRVNEELSLPKAKQILVQSHVTYLVKSARDWMSRIDSRYPNWSVADRTFLALVAIDLENVSGYRLSMPQSSASPCSVLKLEGKPKNRSNWSVISEQKLRVMNAQQLTTSRHTGLSELPCLQT